MSTIALSLFILACGWKLYKDWIVTRYSALRNSGHPQYFAAAIAAGYLFLVAACVHAWANDFVLYQRVLEKGLSFLPQPLQQPNESVSTLHHLASVTLWVAILITVLPWLFNWPIYRSPPLLLSIAKKVGSIDQFESLVHHCLRSGLLTAITLSSGKVYIGVPVRSSTIDQDRTWLKVWPFASGYRNESSELKIITYYQTHYEAINAQDDDSMTSSDFSVVIPLSQIVSAQTFDLATYAVFKGDNAVTVSVNKVSRASDGHVNNDGKNQNEWDSTELVEDLLTIGDKHRLMMYRMYLGTLTCAIVCLPYNEFLAIALGFISTIAAADAIGFLRESRD